MALLRLTMLVGSEKVSENRYDYSFPVLLFSDEKINKLKLKINKIINKKLKNFHKRNYHNRY